MPSVSLVAITEPKVPGVLSVEEFVAYAARVSNPANQMNSETAPKLLAYLVKNRHWSPFEMISVTMEVVSTRDIVRQMLRHRSFSFQEFSQRYATVEGLGFTLSEARLQDSKNRQASIDIEDNGVLQAEWNAKQQAVIEVVTDAYEWALSKNIAKEVARKVLPEGLTNSKMYMAGTLRSWIHFCSVRTEIGTQKEHREVANGCLSIIKEQFPAISGLL